jgi:Xaa-Pro aminopeptidase
MGAAGAVTEIPSELFAERRARLREQIGDGVALPPGAHLATRSNDVDHVFRQQSDLLYLTGFDQPDAVCVLRRNKLVLFVQPRDPAAETWTGLRHGVEGAQQRFGADEAYPIDELEQRLPNLLEAPRLYCRLGRDRAFDDVVHRALDVLRVRARRGATVPGEIVDPGEVLGEMRLRKHPEELRVMRAAAEISRDAHHAAARLCRAGTWEYEIEAELFRVFRGRGGAGPAYPSIVGSGENATILHYVENTSRLEPGELVLIDAGVELNGYASDVTRTYPVDGRFEGPGRDVYAAVLSAQEAAIGLIGPGVTASDVHRAAVRVLCEALVELGALEGDPDELTESEAHRPFYMHSTGHWLGLDVHDVGAANVDGKPRPLEPGMVITCEPGLYLSAREEKTPPELRGIGVRIEDDVVVTEEGHEILTHDIPKRIDDVEAWMRQS